jgi:hypothetical protein
MRISADNRDRATDYLTSHVQSAAIPLSALTASQALRVHGSPSAGQLVLIHGGAGPDTGRFKQRRHCRHYRYSVGALR